jgi:hypothetical protein
MNGARRRCVLTRSSILVFYRDYLSSFLVSLSDSRRYLNGSHCLPTPRPGTSPSPLVLLVELTAQAGDEVQVQGRAMESTPNESDKQERALIFEVR